MSVIGLWIARLFPTFAPALKALANPWVLLAITLWSAGCFSYGLFLGKDAGARDLAEHLAQDAVAQVAFVQKIVKLAGKVRTVYVRGETEIQHHYIYVEKEAEHVPERPACNVTAGWMRVHDAAAAGPGGRIDGAVDDATDTGVTERQVLDGAIVPNYRAYHQVVNDLKACRAFVGGLGK